MKTQSHIPILQKLNRAVAYGLILLAADVAHAASGTWTNAVDAPDNFWSATTNWLDNIIADGAGNTATFSNELSAPVTVNLDSARTVGNLLFIHGGYTITNNGVDAANILTLNNGAAKPVVSVPSSATATIRRTVLAGTNGFIVDGGGTFALFKQTGNPTNTISGNVILSNSIVAVQEGGTDFNVIDPALDSLGSFTFYGDSPGSTLNLLSDASTGPSYGTANNNLIVPEGQVGTVILPPRFNGSAADNAAAPGTGLGGTLTGGGTLNVRTRYIRGTVVGDWSAFTGQINVTPDSAAADNEWRLAHTNGFPNVSLHLTGTTPMGMRYILQPAVNGTVILVGVLSSDNPASYITGSTMAGRTLTYRAGAKHTNATDTATFAGELRNVPTGVDITPRLAIIKDGAGTWILTGNNSHGGGTTISNGVLQIGDGSSESGSLGSGPVTNHAALVISRGGSLTVSGAIRGNGSLTNSGSGGTVTLTGANTYTGPTVVTLGKLVIGTASALPGSFTVRDGASLGGLVLNAGASATLGNISFGAGCSLDVDVAGLGLPTTPVVVNTGALTLNGSDITVNVAAVPFTFTTGTFTVLEYASRSGGGNFVLGTLPLGVSGATLNDDTVNKRVTVTFTTIADPTRRYVGDAAGLWNSGNLTNLIWREVGSGLITNYNDGDFVRFDDTATGTPNIDLSTTLSPSAVTVNNSTLNYQFGGLGMLTGTTPLTKQGTGKLTILNANDFTGLTTIDAGTIQLGNGGDVGQLGFGNIVNNGQLIVNRTNAVTINGDISGAGSVTVIGLDTNPIVTFTPPSLVGSTYTGGTTVSNAVVEMGNARANGLNAAGTGLGTGPVTFYGNCGLNLFQSAAGGAGNATGDNGYDFGVTLNVPEGSTLDYHVAPRSRETTTLLGAGTVMLRGAGVRCYVLGGNWSAFAGQIIFYGYLGAADLRLNSANDLPLAKVHLANTDGLGNIARMMNQGDGLLPYRIGELSGDYGAEINGNNGDGGDAPASTVWIVGGLNTDSVFAGTTADPANADHNFVKAGTGRWTMAGTNLHQGFTTVSNGVLALVDTAGLSNSVTVTVAAPGILDVSGRTNGPLSLGTGTNVQTLAGNGTIRGSVVLGANGRLSPGFSVGTLTVTNAVTLGGTNIMEVESPSNSDRLSAATIVYGGTLIITNLGPIIGTNTFQLFSGGISGTFTSVILPSLSGVTWNTSNLGVNGTITAVGPTLNPNPTNITATVSGNQLDLQWPASHTGWGLQTNAVSVADPNSWFVYPPSLTTNRVVLTIDPTRANVYYRLHLQLAP